MKRPARWWRSCSASCSVTRRSTSSSVSITRRDKQLHLYFQLWERAVEVSYSVGATRLDSGQTGYRVKRELGHHLVALDCYCRHRNPLLNRVFGAVAKGITWQSLDPDLQTVAEEQ